MAVIAIRKDYASGGGELGEALAKSLGYQYVDKALLQKVAEDLNVSQTTLESFEMSREYRVPNLFSNLFSKDYIERIVGHDKSVVAEKEYQSSLRNLIRSLAREDNVVIAGRAAHFFLQDFPNCYSVRVVAPMQYRKRYAVENLGMDPDVVQTVLEKKDRNLLWFHRSVCGEGHDDPLQFHLTLNMGLISAGKALALLKLMVEQ